MDDVVPKTTWEALKHMSNNKAYLCLVMAVAGMFFIVTNIQFWMSDYMVVIYEADPKWVKKVFMFVCLTSPTLGAISVSCIPVSWDKYKLCLILGIIGGIVGI